MRTAKYLLLLTLIIVLSVIYSNVSVAGDILIGAKSFHVNKYQCNGCERFRETNPLIGYSGDKYSTHYMKNSYNKDSVVAVRTFKHDLTKNITPFLAVGAATGYDEHVKKLSKGSLTAVGYAGIDVHPKSKKLGLILTVTPYRTIGVALKIKINNN